MALALTVRRETGSAAADAHGLFNHAGSLKALFALPVASRLSIRKPASVVCDPTNEQLDDSALAVSLIAWRPSSRLERLT